MRRGIVYSVALLVSVVLAPSPLFAAGPIAACQPGNTTYCGFDRPEDLAALPGSRWIVVSHASDSEPLELLDPVSGRRVAATLGANTNASTFTTQPECADTPLVFKPAGIDARRVHGTTWVVAINRVAKPRIELFEVRALQPVPKIVWRGCIPVPANYMLNDVALAPDGQLFASHMFAPPATPTEANARRAAFVARQPTGYVIRWGRDQSWSKVAGTDLSFANGVAVSRDGRWLAAAGTFDQTVVLIDRRTGRTQRLDVGLQPDNLTPAGRSGFVVAGHTGVPVTGIDPCRTLTDQPCGFPFAVARLDAARGSANTVFRDDGATTPGASVALLQDGVLYLGSAFGDRITAIRTPTDAARIQPTPR